MGRVIHASPLGMQAIYITSLVHKISNEHSRGTRAEVQSSLLSRICTHTRTASERKLNWAEATTAVGLVSHGESTVGYL